MTARATTALGTSISTSTHRSLNDYLDTLNEGTAGQEPENIYRMVVDEVERPMLELIMRWAHGNQSHAARALGINRATLRTKLKRHGLLP